MATTVQEAIRRLRVEATSSGVKEVTSDLNAMSRAQDGVAVASEQTTRATLSQEKRFESIERRYVATVRAQQEYDKVQRQVNAAVAQNPALQERANAVLVEAKRRFDDAAAASARLGHANDNIGFQTKQTLLQLPDIIQGIAGGQGVFRTALQQGGQLVQVYGMGPGGVGGSMKQVASEMTSLITPARLVAVGVAASGAAAYAAYAYWKSFTLQLDDAARAAGTSTAEMSKLQAVASFKGIASSEFNQGIQGFAKGVYEAKSGMGGLAEVFAANNTHAKSFDDYLGKAADLIKNARDDQQRLVLLQQMGLPATMQWVRLLGNGAVGLQDAKNKAAEFAADQRLVERARQFDEAWNRAWTNFGLRARSAFQVALDAGASFLDRIDRAQNKIAETRPDLAYMVGKKPITDASSFDSRYSAANSGSSYPAMSDALRQKADQIRNGSTVDPAALQRQLSLQQQYVGVLGQTATVEQSLVGIRAQLQQYALTPGAIQLTEKQRDAIIEVARQQALGTAQINSQADAYRVEASTIGMSVGAAAAYSAAQNVINQAKLQGKSLTADNIAEIQREAAALGALAQSLAEASLKRDIKFNLDTAFLSDADKQIASILQRVYGDEWKNMMDGPIAGAIRLNNQLADINSTIRSSASSFANDFVSGIMSGKTAMDSLKGAASSLGKTLTSAGINNIIANPMNPVGYVEAGIGVLAQMFGGADESKKKLEEAKRVWKEAGPAFQQFLTEMSGGVQGELMNRVASARQRASELGDKAWEAEDYAAVRRIVDSYSKYVQDQSRAFLATFQATARGLGDGLGMDSPFLKAVSTIKDQLASVQSFVDDTRTSTGILSGALSEDTLALTGNAAAIAYMNGEVAKATDVSRTYLLSLLGTAPQLSTVATRMLDIQGRAAALQGALEQLGMSSGDAAAAIAGGVQKAIADLRKSFEGGLTSRLNTATGKGYMNDALALLAQRNQDIADAASLGLDMNLVSTVFAAEAQKIVDDAGLVGDAFNEFTTIFPDLAGVVTQSASAIEKAAQAQKQALDASAKSILDYLNSLTAGTASTLAPAERLAAAQAAYNAKLTLAQGGNLDAQSSIVQDAENLRLAAQAMYASGAQYQAIVAAIKSQLSGLSSVQQTTDPLLVAMRDVQAAVIGTTTAVHGTTGAVNTTGAANDNLQTVQNQLAAQQVNYLASQQALLGAINNLTVSGNTTADRIINAINGLGQLTYDATKSQNDLLLLMVFALGGHGSPPPIPGWPGFQNGGVIPGYATGGMIGNGLYGIDSVVARLPNGRPIGLAGGEFVMPADQTRRFLPQLEGMRQGRPAGESLDWQPLARAIKQAIDISDERLLAKIDELIASNEASAPRIKDALRQIVAGAKPRAA